MRSADRTVPVVAAGPRPVSRWPADLFIAIERLAAYSWDSYVATWDDSGTRYVWDDPNIASTFIDATCWWQGLDITSGPIDQDGRLDAAHLTLTLDNSDGRWSQFDSLGRQTSYQPGQEIDVWAHLDGEDWWLFSGLVTAWREHADATVEVEAFDFASDLNQPIGQWNPGTFGQKPEARLASILTLVGSSRPTRFDAGQVTLHSYLTTATPLEECQAVAVSDGGVFGCDADGTIVYRNRSWPGGRTDQTTVPTLSDNVCGVPQVVWEPALTTDDEFLVSVARLTNLEQLVAQAQSTGATHAFPLARSGDQWVTQAEGDDLASFTVTRRSAQYLRIESFTLHLIDPRQDLWRAGIDLRLGDVVRFVHDQPAVTGTDRLDLNLLITGVHHQITPEAWTVTPSTSRAVGNNLVYRWDTAVLWDDPATRWGF